MSEGQSWAKHNRLLTDIEKKGGRQTPGLTFPQIADEACGKKDFFYGKKGAEKRQFFVKAFHRYKTAPIKSYLESLQK